MSDPIEPFENGPDGDRNADGRFRKGWKGGPGSPAAKYARQLRERLNDALFKVCSPDRLVNAIDAVLKRAEAGDVMALKLLLERIGGPPISTEIAERIEALESLMENQNARR